MTYNNNTIYQETQDVVFIDAYNLIYRAYHGNQSKLTNLDGMPTNAIYTVATMLLKLRKQFTNLAYTLAVFDGGGNFRTEINADYKAHRKPMPEELKVQMPHIKELFTIMGWPIMQADNVEADDVIGSLAIRAGAKGFNTYIVSSDKDFRQIVTSNINVLDTMQDVCYDPEKVKEKMGVYPENVVAWLALVGDETDNITGVELVGKGTAPKLLTTYGSLENLIANQTEIKGKIGEKLREAISNGQLQQSVELATLKTDLDITLTKKELRLKDIDNEAWGKFCDSMNFKSFTRNFKP
jgi:DNA polymerase-1